MAGDDAPLVRRPRRAPRTDNRQASPAVCLASNLLVECSPLGPVVGADEQGAAEEEEQAERARERGDIDDRPVGAAPLFRLPGGWRGGGLKRRKRPVGMEK